MKNKASSQGKIKTFFIFLYLPTKALLLYMYQSNVYSILFLKKAINVFLSYIRL